MPDATEPSGLLHFTMPSLGADMDAGTIVEWRIAPGASVRRGDVVAVVETDKSDLDVEVWDDGTVVELVVPVGVKVPVGTVLATLAPTGGRTPAASLAAAPAAFTPVPTVAAAPPAPPARVAPGAPSHLSSPVLRHLAEELHVDTGHLHGSGPGGRITRDDVEHAATRRRATPRARRLARELGVDLAAVPAGGIVTGDLVTAAAQTAIGRAPAPEPAPAPAPAATSGAPAARGTQTETMRRAIARLMTAAWQEIPHYQVATRIDLHVAIESLERRNAEHTAAERILPAAVLVHAAARAAAAVPGVNGHWVDDAFVPGDGVHVAVVVALRSGGLLAPVIRDAASKDLVTVMAEMRDLVTRARTGRLRASEVGGATFTVTELGEAGVDRVVPIIHPPQVAILGLGAVHDEAWAEHGMIAVRPVVHATLAGDHRAIDGRLGSLYLTTLTKFLQEPIAP